MIRKAAILAGGKGTRLGSLAGDRPKPMVAVDGVPLLERQIRCLTRYGVDEVFLLTRHRSEVIENHFGDGSDFGVTIRHIVEDEPLGTGGALRGLAGLADEDFYLIFGDVAFDMALSRLAAFHEARHPLATLVVHPSDHPLDSDLVRVDRFGMVRELVLKPHAGEPPCNLGNAGLFVISPDLLTEIPDRPGDLMKDVLADTLAAGHPLAAYRTPEYLKDMGTPDRLTRVNDDMASGRVAARNLDGPRFAVFLDRDGTLIEQVDQLCRADDLAPFEFSGPALRRLNRSNFLSVLVTNQSVVARGLCSPDDLFAIHDRMEALFGRAGGWLDALYFCPHHPDGGYPEENPEFKVPCDCRKPGIGMFTQAAADLNIDMVSSWMVGDTTTDILAGKKAGVRTILVHTGLAGKDGKFDVRPDFEAQDLAGAVDIILGEGA